MVRLISLRTQIIFFFIINFLLKFLTFIALISFDELIPIIVFPKVNFFILFLRNLNKNCPAIGFFSLTIGELTNFLNFFLEKFFYFWPGNCDYYFWHRIFFGVCKINQTFSKCASYYNHNFCISF